MRVPNGSTALYDNQEEASKELISLIPKEYFHPKDSVVIGISEAGVYFALQISKSLKIPMNILLSEPILAPNNSELVVAMVSETEEMVSHTKLIDSFGIDKDYIYSEAQRQYEESVLAHIYKYRKGLTLENLKGKNIILVDECIETGLTMTVALKSMIEMGVRSVYVAVPILDKSIYQNLLTLCDGVFSPHQIDNYISIEYYFKDREIFSFEELEQMIENSGLLTVSKQIKE
jgi:putative phosphoribosyl transferase